MLTANSCLHRYAIERSDYTRGTQRTGLASRLLSTRVPPLVASTLRNGGLPSRTLTCTLVVVPIHIHITKRLPRGSPNQPRMVSTLAWSAVQMVEFSGSGTGTPKDGKFRLSYLKLDLPL